MDQAENFYRQALKEDPNNPDGLNLLAAVTNEKGNVNEAIELLEKAVRAVPGNPQFSDNLGQLYMKNGRLEEALEAYGSALRADPNYADAHNNLGNTLQELGRLDAAVASYNKAIAIKPDYIKAYSNLGSALQDLGRLEDAVASLQKALALKPDYAEAHNNLGNALRDLGRSEDAVASFQKALALKPDYAEAHNNLGNALQNLGRLKEGWEEFEWRWQCPNNEKFRDFTQPPWQGEDLQGKTILVISEQGIGDEVMFAAQVPDLLGAGAAVVLECEKRLAPVFGRSFPDVECVIKADPPATAGRDDIDFQIAGASLGRFLRPDVESYPVSQSFLLADVQRRDALRAKYLGEKSKDGGNDLLVGLAWNSKNTEMGPMKSLPLSDYVPLTEIFGIRFIDLQYGDTAAEREAFEKETGVEVFHDPDIDQLHDLDAFSAQVAAMDLVISISTVAVHFAGALGVPTWVLLNTVPLSRWMREGKTSHLYPSVRLYRQAQAGEWADVIDAVKGDLSRINPS